MNATATAPEARYVKTINSRLIEHFVGTVEELANGVAPPAGAPSALVLPPISGAADVPLHDCAPQLASFQDDVYEGLSHAARRLSCKWFYDARGSKLFDDICELPEYYPTRTETGILRDNIEAIAERLGSDCALVELGSGSSVKTRILLDHLRSPAAYLPLDISGEHLLNSARELQSRYPAVPVQPVCADYTSSFTLPELARPAARTVVFFPGSTIGNFHPEAATEFLRHMAQIAGPGGGLLIGVDLRKNPRVLERAYDDKDGVTAEFNLNLLRRINRELHADFDLRAWAHHAFYNDDEGRIEMHLLSLCPQTVHIGLRTYEFAAGETIHTECSYKYSLEGFASIAAAAGWDVEEVWTDARQWFSVQYLSVKP